MSTTHTLPAGTPKIKLTNKVRRGFSLIGSLGYIDSMRSGIHTVRSGPKRVYKIKAGDLNDLEAAIDWLIQNQEPRP